MKEDNTEIYIKRVSKGAAIIFFGLIISNFLGYLTRMVIVRFYGVEDYGLFSLGNTIVGIAIVISMFGMQESIVRFISYYKGKNNIKKIKGTIISALKISISMSIILSIIIIVFSKQIAIDIFHEPRLSTLLFLFAIIIPFSVILTNLISDIRGFQAMKYKVYAEDILKSSVVFISLFIFYFLCLDIKGAILSYLIGFFFAISISIYYLKKIFPSIFFIESTIPMKKELLFFSWPLMISTYIKILLSWTDTITLGIFNAAYDVGLYNIALPTAGLIYIFAFSFRYIVTPIMSELYAKKDYVEIKYIYNSICKWIFIITFPLLLIIILFNDNIITLLFGVEALKANTAFVILSIGYFILSFIGASSIILLVIGKTKIIMMNTITATITNVILNILLIPKPIGLDIIGAAIATSTSLILLSVLHMFFCYNYTKLYPFQASYFKSILSALFSVFVFYFLLKFIISLENFLINIFIFPFFILFYFIILLKMKTLDKNDIMILKLLENKTGVKLKFLKEVIKKFI